MNWERFISFADPKAGQSSDVVHHELSYAGFAVYWLEPKGKRIAADRTLGSNLGVRTGGTFWVLDIDGERGEISWQWLCRMIPGLSSLATLEVKTGRGRHLYWENAGTLHSSVGFLPGMDVRAKGSHVVIPPSVHENGTRYSFLCKCHPQPAPAALFDLAMNAEPQVVNSDLAEKAKRAEVSYAQARNMNRGSS